VRSLLTGSKITVRTGEKSMIFLPDLHILKIPTQESFDIKTFMLVIATFRYN
jgi:hypothetical protein